MTSLKMKAPPVVYTKKSIICPLLHCGHGIRQLLSRVQLLYTTGDSCIHGYKLFDVIVALSWFIELYAQGTP